MININQKFTMTQCTINFEIGKHAMLIAILIFEVLLLQIFSLTRIITAGLNPISLTTEFAH